jgi:hypothetical protein
LYVPLADAFLHRQLHLTSAPDPRLIALSNPYDPAQRADIPYQWDVSLFDGKYYVYFGPVPVLLFYIPAKYLSGHYPHHDFMVLLLSLGCVAALTACLALVRARLGLAGAWPLPVWALLVAFGSGLAVQLGGGVYVIAAQSGLLFHTLFVFFMLLAMVSRSSARYISLLAAGSCVGLAIGSRPTETVLVVVAPIVWCMAVRRPVPWHALAKELAYLMMPIAGICALLLYYNYVRFGSATEFGISYQLGLADLRQMPLCGFGCWYSTALVAHQLWLHFLSPPVMTGAFPFFSFPLRGDSPFSSWISHYVGADHVTGILWLSPILIPGLGGLLLYFRRLPRHLQATVGGLLVGSVLTVVYIASCRGAGARYVYDIHFSWLLCSIIGIWLLFGEVRRPLARWTLCGVTSLLVSFSVFQGICATFDGHFSKRISAVTALHELGLAVTFSQAR